LGQQELDLILGSGEVVEGFASELFGLDSMQGYVVGKVSEGEGVVAFQLVQLTDQKTTFGMNASTDFAAGQLYSAQLADVAGVFTEVNLINTSSSDRDVQLSALAPDGSQAGDVPALTLTPGEQRVIDAGTVFGNGVTAAGMGQTGKEGTLRVDVPRRESSEESCSATHL